MNHKEELSRLEQNTIIYDDSYSSKYVETKQRLVILATNYPNVLCNDKTIYNRCHIFSSTTSTIKNFYESRGIKCVIVGPTGLGASAFQIFGPITQWIIDQKDLLKFMPMLFNIIKMVFKRYLKYKEDKNEALLRSVKFRIRLNLTLYIDEGQSSKDLIPYVQQLVSSSMEMTKQLDQKMDYVDYFISYTVNDLRSDNSSWVNLSNNISTSAIGKVIYKLSKKKPSAKNAHVSVSKWLFWTKVS